MENRMHILRGLSGHGIDTISRWVRALDPEDLAPGELEQAQAAILEELGLAAVVLLRKRAGAVAVYEAGDEARQARVVEEGKAARKLYSGANSTKADAVSAFIVAAGLGAVVRADPNGGHITHGNAGTLSYLPADSHIAISIPETRLNDFAGRWGEVCTLSWRSAGRAVMVFSMPPIGHPWRCSGSGAVRLHTHTTGTAEPIAPAPMEGLDWLCPPSKAIAKGASGLAAPPDDLVDALEALSAFGTSPGLAGACDRLLL